MFRDVAFGMTLYALILNEPDPLFFRPDYDKGSSARLSFTAKGSLAAVKDRMLRYSGQTNGLNLDYDPIYKNSNAYAHEYMRLNGYSVQGPGKWAPGWNTCLNLKGC